MTKPLFVARLAGSQETMGAQHGALVADDARELVDFYRTMPERALAGGMPGAGGKIARLVARGVATAWQANLARTRPAELAARSRAFMRAATGSADRIALYTLATMDSMQNCVSLAARAGLGPFAGMQTIGDEEMRPDLRGLDHVAARVAASAAPACTSVIAWGAATEGGELLFARNFDFPGVGVWDTAPAFVVNAPAGGQRYAFFARRGADTAVVTVVNEAGLVLAPHTRWHTGAGVGGAMIVDVVHEIARRAETLDDAIRIARERPISSTWGIAVGSARENSALVLEIAGPAVEVVRPAAGASFLVCANRYRTPSLQAGQVAASRAWADHSEKRERRLRALVGARTGLTAEDLARFLGDRRDVDAPERPRRMGAILAQPTNVHCAVVAPAARRALVGIDRAPCCEGRWADIEWTWNGPTGGWELAGEQVSRDGFSIRIRTDVAAPQDAATRHVHDAVRAYEGSHDVAAARTAFDRAIAGDPADPSLRLAAAWLALEAGDHTAAAAHVEIGLAHETDALRREQLQRWGKRAAAGALAPRPVVNLVMVDAY